MLTAYSAAAILLLRRVRTRTKFILCRILSAAGRWPSLTTIGVGHCTHGQPPAAGSLLQSGRLVVSFGP